MRYLLMSKYIYFIVIVIMIIIYCMCKNSKTSLNFYSTGYVMNISVDIYTSFLLYITKLTQVSSSMISGMTASLLID